jgi:hypothetical protein
MLRASGPSERDIEMLRLRGRPPKVDPQGVKDEKKRPPRKHPEKRKGNPRVVREIIKRIHARRGAGLPSGMSIEKVKGLISDKDVDGFRPGWDAVKTALIAIGYILPKD